MNQNLMGRCALVSFKTLLLASLLLSLSNSGGGDGGGGTPVPVATPADTIVAGSVQAPVGQIAFFKPSLTSLLGVRIHQQKVD